ncbi:MAG: tRNA-specific adenosine deaminase [Thermoleophilia bacterium]
MREALREAEHALSKGERPIGAVVVHDGRIVGRGRAQHRERRSQIAHAEIIALLDAAHFLDSHAHEGSILYTTLEPCVMCLGAVVMSDVDAVVFSLSDKRINPANMLQIPYVREHIMHYMGGVLEHESRVLWERFSPRELRVLTTGEKVL